VTSACSWEMEMTSLVRRPALHLAASVTASERAKTGGGFYVAKGKLLALNKGDKGRLIAPIQDFPARVLRSHCASVTARVAERCQASALAYGRVRSFEKNASGLSSSLRGSALPSPRWSRTSCSLTSMPRRHHLHLAVPVHVRMLSSVAPSFPAHDSGETRRAA
jgi:hypothetical protein